TPETRMRAVQAPAAPRAAKAPGAAALLDVGRAAPGRTRTPATPTRAATAREAPVQTPQSEASPAAVATRGPAAMAAATPAWEAAAVAWAAAAAMEATAAAVVAPATLATPEHPPDAATAKST